VGKELLHNPPEPLRLYGKREALKDRLLARIGNDEEAMKEMMASLALPSGLKV
jgi:formiminotetrahydrofolate cyclodeaminase